MMISVASHGRELVVFTNLAGLHRLRQERAQASETRLAITTHHRKLETLVERLARLIRRRHYHQYRRNQMRLQKTRVEPGWGVRRAPRLKQELRRVKDLRGPSGTLAKH